MPRLLSPRPLAAVVAVVVALAMGACTQDEDVTQERFESDLIERTRDADDDPTITEDEAACITEAVFDSYDQSEINRIYRAATEDELGNERRDELVAINDRCLAQDATEDPEG